MVVGKLARGAISLTGNLLGGKHPSAANTEHAKVEVVLRPLVREACDSDGQLNAPYTALVNPEEEALAPFLTPSCFLVLTSGSDCVLTVRASTQVAVGCIALDDAQMHNLHIAEGESERSWTLFRPPAAGEVPFALTDLTAEVRARGGLLAGPGRDEGDTDEEVEDDDEGGGAGVHGARGVSVKVDAQVLARTFHNLVFGRVVAVGETIPVTCEGRALLLRVTTTNNLDEEEQAEQVVYHCYRGLVTGDSQVACLPSATDISSGLQLTNLPPPRANKAGTTGHLVHITTSDDEWFPVKKKLLRPCITLTKAVQDKGDAAPEVTVDVPCLVFDRVLLFLEADAMGRTAEFNVDINQVEDLLAAALVLQCRPLEEVCRKLLGDFEQRIREYTFEEVLAANASGKVLILIDFMVLDVTRWLPEHPGGNTIIPQQALGVDATCFFELYHVSRESFMYLKQFYIGELREEDRSAVPCKERASDHFMQQLREYTQFRIAVTPMVQTFKSF